MSSRRFVLFLLDRVSQIAPQLDEPVLELAGVGSPLGELAVVLGFPMDVFQQGLELLGERDVVVRASEASLAAKFAEGNSAVRTDEMIELLQRLGLFLATLSSAESPASSGSWLRYA